LETYTINMRTDGPVAIFIGRNGHGERVCGNADLAHEPTRVLFESGEPFGAELAVMQDERGRNIAKLA
jgi:acetyl-CoA C-acetyltransferase